MFNRSPASAYDKESNLPGHFYKLKAFYAIIPDIISIPSNVKHVLAKCKWEDIFMK